MGWQDTGRDAFAVCGAALTSGPQMSAHLGWIIMNGASAWDGNELFLAAHWRLMGALEAVNGVMLFGLTTAFMYGMIQLVWPIEKRRGYRQ